jgi:two-component system heavy metal sensor histidine kinase CusS
VTAAASAPPSSVPSLGRRLSRWLALQGLVAALAVSAVVYAVNAWVLDSRQHDELQLKQDVVRHALAETAVSADTADLQHKLNDFLAGHQDMTLSVQTTTGQLIYKSAPARSERFDRRMKTSGWTQRWTASTDGEVIVDLSLDVGRDDALLRRLWLTLLMTSLAGAAVVSFTGFLLVSRGLRPIRDLSAQVEQMALDRPQLRLDGSAQPRELAPLVGRFNVLLSRVERAYAQLEAFNADVAHELRTPLTTLIGASELALRRERPVAELREVIAANLEDLRRLAGIVNDMLFLSRADRGAAARRTPVDSLAATLSDILDYHEAALQDRGLTAQCEGDVGGAFDVALLRRGLSNLLSNATRYALPGSVIRISIEPFDGRVRLAVVNDGNALEPQHLPKLFDRFYRVERSRQRTDVNHGLGLAIVAAIARMHGGEPFALSDRGVTRIGMDIPLAAPAA